MNLLGHYQLNFIKLNKIQPTYIFTFRHELSIFCGICHTFIKIEYKRLEMHK